MNSKTTVGLLLLVVVLFGYIYFVDLRRDAPVDVSHKTIRLLPNFDPAKVTSIEITRSNQTLRAELVNSEWRLVTPPYPAQSTAIENFLHTLSVLNRQTEVSAQEIISQSGGLSPFGLDPPSARIKLQVGTQLLQLKVGTKTLLGDRVYIQPDGASGIFATEDTLLRYLPETIDQWRNPLLLLPETLIFDHITLSAGSRQPLKLERDRTNMLWRVAEPMAARADFNRVELGLLHPLRQARVNQFVTDDPKADLIAFGLQPPDAELSLAFGTNPVFQLQFGKSPTNDTGLVYARCLSHTNVVLVPRDLAETAQRPLSYFRDHRLFTFSPRGLDRIEVNASEGFALQRQADNRWRIYSPFAAPTDPQLMQLFLDQLAKFEVLEFAKDVETDFSGYGLATPQRQYSLLTSLTNAAGVTNQLLLRVDFGNCVSSNELDKVFSRRSDENSVYVVGSFDMNNLPHAAFELRDRRVWAFASSNVTGVTIFQRAEKLERRRDFASRAWVKDDQVASAGIEEALHRLGELEADAWTDKGERRAALYGTASGRHQIVLDLSETGKSRSLTLSLGNLSPSGQPYAAVVLEQNEPVIFKLPAQLYELIVQYLSIPTAAGQ